MSRTLAFSAFFALWLPSLSPALAQVSLNPGALDALQPAPQAPEAHRPDHHPAARPAPRRRERASPAKPASGGPPVLPVAPPPPPNLPPPVPVPLRPVKVPEVPIAPDAIGKATLLPNGLRVTFGTEQAALNPGVADALHRFALVIKPQLAAHPDWRVMLTAYAAGQRDDVSSARRLSLRRALAIRALLLTDGIASPRILVRAMGRGDDTPPRDRADLILSALPQ